MAAATLSPPAATSRGADDQELPLDISPPTRETTALVHQLALAQGGRYRSALDERVWSASPALIDVPARGGDVHGPRLPAGLLLVLPWEQSDPAALDVWLGRLQASGAAMPQHVALISAAGPLPARTLAAVAAERGVRLGCLDLVAGEAAGDPALAEALAVVLAEDAAEALAWVNPLAHLRGRIADPRDPRVFAERLRRAAPRVWVGHLLLGLNVLVFLLMQASDGWPLFSRFSYDAVLSFGANTQARTLGAGETWRLLTCTFVHADLLHLAMNMWALRVLGDTAERLFGALAFALLYLIAGLGGSVVSLAFTLAERPDLPSVGASGAIFGLMGGLLGFALARRGSVPPQLYRSLTRSAVMFIVINGAIGLSVDFIDNGAHMGGLAYGLAGGLLLSRELPPAPQPHWSVRALAVIGLGAAVWLGLAAAG